MKVCLTNIDRKFKDEWQEGVLSEQGAWWEPNGDLWVWTPTYNTKRKQIGAIVHEGIEYLIIGNYNIHNEIVCNFIHWVANILEIIFSLGNSPVLKDTDYWQWQKWSKKDAY